MLVNNVRNTNCVLNYNKTDRSAIRTNNYDLKSNPAVSYSACKVNSSDKITFTAKNNMLSKGEMEIIAKSLLDTFPDGMKSTTQLFFNLTRGLTSYSSQAEMKAEFEMAGNTIKALNRETNPLYIKYKEGELPLADFLSQVTSKCEEKEACNCIHRALMLANYALQSGFKNGMVVQAEIPSTELGLSHDFFVLSNGYNSRPGLDRLVDPILVVDSWIKDNSKLGIKGYRDKGIIYTFSDYMKLLNNYILIPTKPPISNTIKLSCIADLNGVKSYNTELPYDFFKYKAKKHC